MNRLSFCFCVFFFPRLLRVLLLVCISVGLIYSLWWGVFNPTTAGYYSPEGALTFSSPGERTEAQSTMAFEDQQWRTPTNLNSGWEVLVVGPNDSPLVAGVPLGVMAALITVGLLYGIPLLIREEFGYTYWVTRFQHSDGVSAEIALEKVVTPDMIDCVGHMNYLDGYLKAMECCRWWLMEKLDWPQKRLVQQGLALMIKDLEGHYLRQVFLGQTILVHGRVELDGILLRYTFQIFRDDGRECFHGGFTMPLVSLDTGRVKKDLGWILSG